MADEDDTELDLDHGDNRPADMILDEKIVKMGEELAAIFRKRKVLNDDAKTIYSNAGKLGIPPKSIQHAVTMVRMMDRDDRKQYTSGIRRVVKALEPVAAAVFAEDIQRTAARKARDAEKETKAKAKAAEEKAKSIERGDDMPRSNPKRGGAGGVSGRKKAPAPKTIKEAAKASDEALAASIADVHAQEQEVGDSILSAHIAEMDKRANEYTVPETEGVDATGLTGKTGFGSISDERPLPQSEIAKQKREAAFGSEW